MPSNPYVSLAYDDLNPNSLRLAETGLLTTPETALEAALLSQRMLMVNRMKQDVAKRGVSTLAELLDIMDVAARVSLGRFSKTVGPSAAAAYLRAYEDAKVGRVPMSTVYALADRHTERLGEYFNLTSREAMIQGFNTFVNQKVPQRVAAERVIDAFGLTPRQMSGYTSLKPRDKVLGAQPMNWAAATKDYVARSLRERFRIFADQEAHNMTTQAKQTAWLWMQNHGMLSPLAQKVWITAKDERVCPQCGPLHGKRIDIGEQFDLPNGTKLWVPGAHTKCRCEANLVDVPLRLIQKDILGGNELAEFNEDHPRGEGGKFTAKDRAKAELQQRASRVRTQFRPVGFADPVSSSPFLEDLVERALKEPVIDEKPTLSSKPSLPSLSARPTLAAKPSLAPKPELPKLDAAKPSLGQKGSLSRMKVDMTRDKASMPIKQRLQLRREMSFLGPAIQADQKRARKRRDPLYYKPTVYLNTPVYAVMFDYDIDQHGTFESHPDIAWTTDASDVQQHAIDMYESYMQDMYDHIQYNEGLTVEAKDGSIYHGMVSDSDLYEVIESVALGNHSGDPDWKGENQKALVEWTDADGKRAWTETKTYGELADLWGITPEHFKIQVVRVDEGHDSKLGTTVQEESGTSHGYERWTLTGQFNTAPSARPLENTFNLPIEFLDAQPDAEVELFGDHEERDDYNE